jgi:hypothetical protein
LLPSFDSSEDPFWIGRPNEGFGVGVGIGDEAVDGELQVDDGLEYSALEALARELGEEPFYRVEPGCRGRGEVEGPARMSRQPLPHPWMFVGRVIVDDCVDHFSRRDVRLDRIEEADEQSRPRKSGREDRWSFCLTAGTLCLSNQEIR